jgi:hypothetical protein
MAGLLQRCAAFRGVAALMAGLWIASSGPAAASGKLFYGSRAGMIVSVISMQGLNTRQAVIHTQHTREDAIAFCRDYEQNLTDECVNRNLAVPMNDYVAANCSTGVFVDFFGNRYQFEGLHRGANSDLAKYKIRDLSSGEIEDGLLRVGTRQTSAFSMRFVSCALRTSPEAAGVEFTNGDQPGVRLRKR